MVVSSRRIPIQWQKTYGYRIYSIQIKLWKTSIEERPNSKDRITRAERFPLRTMKKLRSNKKVHGNGEKSHKEIVWQETESTKIEKRRRCVARG